MVNKTPQFRGRINPCLQVKIIRPTQLDLVSKATLNHWLRVNCHFSPHLPVVLHYIKLVVPVIYSGFFKSFIFMNCNEAYQSLCC